MRILISFAKTAFVQGFYQLLDVWCVILLGEVLGLDYISNKGRILCHLEEYVKCYCNNHDEIQTGNDSPCGFWSRRENIEEIDNAYNYENIIIILSRSFGSFL